MFIKNKHLVTLFFIIIGICIIMIKNLEAEKLSFGEIKAVGDVQIESSTGKWIKLKDIYPLLKKTRLKTNEGVVFVTTSSGCRLDLSKDTELEIITDEMSYKVDMKKGTLSFNIAPVSSLIIFTANKIISVERQTADEQLLLGGLSTFKDTQGIVFVNDREIFLKNISGKIRISDKDGLQTKILGAGETFLVKLNDNDNSGAVLPLSEEYPEWTTAHIQGLITGTFFTSATVTAFEAFRGSRGFKSPSGF